MSNIFDFWEDLVDGVDNLSENISDSFYFLKKDIELDNPNFAKSARLARQAVLHEFRRSDLRRVAPNPAAAVIMYPVVNIFESIRDNLFFDKVTPVIGSLVYCELALGIAEHSGIYVGSGKIVHLNGNGEIELVTPNKFLNRLDGYNTAISIYVSCDGGIATGCNVAAQRAFNMIGTKRDYNLMLDNCHQFSSGCLTGDYDNDNNFLWMLKEIAYKKLSANTWRVWDIDI